MKYNKVAKIIQLKNKPYIKPRNLFFNVKKQNELESLGFNNFDETVAEKILISLGRDELKTE